MPESTAAVSAAWDSRVGAIVFSTSDAAVFQTASMHLREKV
jgi:hypothetical protein